VNGQADVVSRGPDPTAVPSGWKVATAAPVVLSTLIVLASVLLGLSKPSLSPVILTLGALLVVGAILANVRGRQTGARWHTLLEGKPLAFTFLVLLAILAGGVAELLPSIVIKREIPLLPTEAQAEQESAVVAGTGYSPEVDPARVQRPYSPLELEGRDIYVREGCYVCHSQMIRPFRHETLRYGDFSRAEEFIYDRPFQWGSKRTGPDLHRVGGKYPNLWHYQHMIDPRSTSPNSNMPPFDFLKGRRMDYGRTVGKLAAMRRLGVPYSDEEILAAEATALSQAALIREDLQKQGVNIEPDSELIAIIGYLQRLGRGPQPVAAAQGGN
jgi:cytochrome c oxidase cbb3-type subunit I/II